MRSLFLQTTFVVMTINLVSYFYYPQILWSMIFFGPLILLGIFDISQISLFWIICVFYLKKSGRKYSSILLSPIQVDVRLIGNRET